MKRVGVSVIIGILLVALGVLFLLNSMRIIQFGWEFVVPIFFGIGGLIFLAVYLGDRNINWWAIIPSFTLLGLAVLIGLGMLATETAGEIGAAIFMGAIALSFWVIYFTRRDFWWAIIPGGVMLTLAAVIAISTRAGGINTGGIFFIGLALTFGLLYLLPTSEGRMFWALVPASILLVMGILLITLGGTWANLFWPVALLAGGGYLLYKGLRK